MKIHPWEVPTGNDWVSTKASIYLSPWGRSCREEDQKHVREIAKFQEAAADYTAWSWKQEERREGRIKSHDGAEKTERTTHLRCPNTLIAFREEVRALKAVTRASDLASGPSSAFPNSPQTPDSYIRPFLSSNTELVSSFSSRTATSEMSPSYSNLEDMAALLTRNLSSPFSHPPQLLPLYFIYAVFTPLCPLQLRGWGTDKASVS